MFNRVSILVVAGPLPRQKCSCLGKVLFAMAIAQARGSTYRNSPFEHAHLWLRARVSPRE
jgi:hypothetical protein